MIKINLDKAKEIHKNTIRGAFLGPYSQASNSYSTGSIRIQSTGVDSNQGIYFDCPYLNVAVFR
jgi:hypothetical protein